MASHLSQDGFCVTLHAMERMAEPELMDEPEQVAAYAGIAQGVHLMAVKAEERIPLILERAGLSSRC